MPSGRKVFTGLSTMGSLIGKGLIAGLAGTVAITVSQMIGLHLRDRGSNQAPMKVAGKVLGVEARGKAQLELEKRHSNGGRSEEELKQSVQENTEQFS